MAIADATTKTRKGQAQPAARQTVSDRMRQDIPGEGVFLVASISAYPNLSYPPPNKDLKDLSLAPGLAIVIDEGWLTSPLLLRDFQSGKVTLRYTNELPPGQQLDPDPDTLEGLPQTMKLMVKTIGEMPFTQQYKDVLRLGDMLGRTGLPKKNSRVTKRYLQGEYAVFLRAVLAYEEKRSNRPEVTDLVTAQLERIEAL